MTASAIATSGAPTNRKHAEVNNEKIARYMIILTGFFSRTIKSALITQKKRNS